MRSKIFSLTLLIQTSCAGGDDAASVTSDSAAGTTSGPTSSSTATGTASMATVVTDTAATDTVATDTAATSTTGETTSSVGDAPFFISFSTNVAHITEGESVVFTAIVSDPQGFSDVAGGSLFTEDAMFSYGPFVSAGQEGAYSIDVSWAQIDQVSAIDFMDFTRSRTFRAEFFDKDGHTVANAVVIELRCDGGGACDGSCKDFQTDAANCGACGGVCVGGCAGGSCAPVLGECIIEEDGYATCDEYCQSVGEACAVNGCDGATNIGYGAEILCMTDEGSNPHAEPCGFLQTWGAGRVSVRCCCSDTN